MKTMLKGRANMRYFILLFFIGYSPLLAGDDDPRAREAGIAPGIYETGRWNAITDVEGVLVGQVSISLGDTVRTGMTAILPHSENIYLNKNLQLRYIQFCLISWRC